MNRLSKLLLSTVAFLGTIVAQAQQDVSTSFTLAQCIEYALANSINNKNALIDQRIADAKVKETIGIGLPQINGSAGIQHNQNLRRFFSRYSTAQGFAGVNEAGDPNLNIPGVSANDVVASQNFFQLKSSGEIGLTISQLIFSGSYLVGLQASKAYKDLSVKNSVLTQEQVVEQVTKSFYVVLINKERSKLFDNNIERVDSLYRNTKALFDNGFAESVDVDRIQVALNNLKSEKERFINLNQLAIELLKFQMNYPMNQPIAIVGNMEDINIDTENQLKSEGADFKNRSEYKILEANKRLQQLNLKNQYAGALPTIAAFANIGYFSQSPEVAGLFSTKTGFSDNGTIGPDKWYGYSLFGISMEMPLFNGLQRRYKLQQEKLTLLKIENGFKSLEQGFELENKQAIANYNNSVIALKSQKENMELAGKVAKITKVKFEQGIGSNLEVIDAESSLRTAQVNYYSALFDAVLAKVDLDKANGRLLQTPNQELK